MPILRCGLGYILVATAVCHPAAATDLEITVQLYDYSGIQPAAMVDVRRVAEGALRKAGIDVRWRNGPAGETDGPECGAGPDDATQLVVGVLPERMYRKIATGSQQFGMATSSSAGGFATHAYVFADRVVDFAKDERAPWTNLLGVTIAHELGHLLLGGNSHYAEGIMRARWRSAEVKQALMGVLTFTPRQAERIRGDVRRRTGARE